MIRYPFNKLIRSNLPDRMRKEGVTLSSKRLSDEEYADELKRKLVEEANEVLDTSKKESLALELADVLEVVRSIADANNISMDEKNID